MQERREPVPFDPFGPLEPGVTLLEASAGTGKTYSITTLFLRLVIEARIPIEKILAVTFTQAATAELTSRIRKRLGEAQRALTVYLRERTKPSGDDLLAFLCDEARDTEEVKDRAERARTAVAAFDRANITTIHGFCQRMLSQHALEAQVPFGVRLIEDQAQLVQEIADDFWVREVARAEPWELQTLATVGVDLEALRRLARLAVDQWDATPLPPAPTFVQRPDASALVTALESAAEVARHARVKDDLEHLRQRFRGERGFEPGGPWKNLSRALEGLAQGRVIARDLATLEVLDEGRLRRELPGGELPPIVAAVTALLAAHAEWRPRAQPWALALRHALVAEVRREYERRSRQRGVWSYDDLLRNLKDALVAGPPHVRAALTSSIGQRFAAVLIDEFQDTDPVQWKIFETVFANRQHHLYLIGDPKQAIYGFRRADVMTYLAASDRAHRFFTLETNYRSDGPLVSAINALFKAQNPDRVFAVAGIPFREVSSRHPARVDGVAAPPVRLLWIPRTRRNTFRGFNWQTSKMTGSWGEQHLPAFVAADIVATLARGITITDERGQARPLSPSDLAVLVHKNDHAVRVQDALRRAGVPAVVHGPRSVFETDEARELLRVLAAVLDPSRVQVVRAALLTRLIGVTALELARMETLASRDLEALIDRLRQWRDAWFKRSFIEAFRRLTSARVDALLALDDGERRLANHLQLGELLHLAVAQKDLKPPGLVAWLERQIRRADRTDDRQQVRLETDEPAVQVVTVHKAKGLEYAFVWCPFLWQKGDQTIRNRRLPDFVFRDLARDPHPRLEIGFDDRDPARQRAHRLKVYAEQSERLRAFYVALTRAKHQVTLYGGAFYDLAESPLGYILLSNVTAHDADSLRDEVGALDRHLTRRDDDALLELLTARLPREHISVALAPRPDPGARFRSPPIDPATLTARTWQPGRRLDVEWRRTSFSGLVQEAAGLPSHAHVSPAGDEEIAQAASDEDRPVAADLFLPVSPDRDIALADLPSGRAIGNCIHRILELADFTDATTLPALVTAELSHYAVDLAHAQALTAALAAVLRTPLDASGLRLEELPAARRLPELAFVFPVAGGYEPNDLAVSHHALIKTFRNYGAPALASWLLRFETTPFSLVRGFLSGSIDLTFRSPRDGRWYILDWKSNHLGRAVSDYAAPALRDAMDHHHYHLQYHLYAVALCRYLAHRLPDFSIARDFGGAFYLFLRGMHPEHPPGTGVFFDRPDPNLLAELDALLRGLGDPHRRQLDLLR